MSAAGGRYRARGSHPRVVGFAISYQREPMLARGLGLEHLRELLIRLARPLLRQDVSLAYGGHWREIEDNFTFDLLRLISAEQEDSGADDAGEPPAIGLLYNHSAWPDNLAITPRIEAQWINCCRIVRVTQEHAGIASEDVVADADAGSGSDRARINGAITLSAMRRIATRGTSIPVPDLPSPEIVPPLVARIALGGRTHGYKGFLPGIFEEALLSFESGRPLYVLGGFGGAAESLARALLSPPGEPRPDEFTVAWQRSATPDLERLLDGLAGVALPRDVRSTADALDALYQRIEQARASPSMALNTGLSDADTRELLATRNMRRAVQLILNGLHHKVGLVPLPA